MKAGKYGMRSTIKGMGPLEYVIYSADTGEGTIINMTHNPYLDYEFLKARMGVYGLKILTPYLPLVYAEYVLRNMARDYNSLGRILPKSRELNERLRFEGLKKLMHDIGEKPLNKFEIVNTGQELPSGSDVSRVYEEYKGRLEQSFKVYDRRDFFLGDSIPDIVQMLYLSGKVRYIPSLIIEKPERKYVCSNCGREVMAYSPGEDIICQYCGCSINDEYLLAFSYENREKRRMPVRYKQHGKLNPIQHRASLELLDFVDGDLSECLLWTVPGSECSSIPFGAVKKVIDRGGRAGVLVPCGGQEKIFRDDIKLSFPDLEYGNNYTDEIVVCKFQSIAGFYKAFDIIIVNEPPGCIMDINDSIYRQIRRALTDGGKIILSTSTPRYKFYGRVQKGEVKCIPVPLREYNKPSPEPRVMLYRGLSQDNIFIPEGILDFIDWSVKNQVGVRIIIPSLSCVNDVKRALLDSGVEEKLFGAQKPGIVIATCSSMHIHVEGAENVVVFFADDRIFTEKALLDAAGLSGRCPTQVPCEVIFTGSRESDEIYNSRMMLRSLNKYAWEMGYLK